MLPAIAANLASTPTLADKVAFLSQPRAYRNLPRTVVCRETHMSWVFLADDFVFKLKKPVRFPYLDFSTLERREAACRAELVLNRRLARRVYLDVIPLRSGPHGLSIGGAGEIVDWMVMMRRLDETLMLDHLIESGSIARRRLDSLVSLLTEFYRGATPVSLSANAHLIGWRQSLAYNKKVLLDARLTLPAGTVRRIDRAQRRFIRESTQLLLARVNGRHIVDGHGDLRPEHIWLGEPPVIIDCLEFNASLRAVDPLDEIAFLSLECERLGGSSTANYIRHRMMYALHEPAAESLFVFYRCHRATLRARLAIAHLLEPHPRTPEKWPHLTMSYLRLANRDAIWLERHFRIRGGPRADCRHAVGGSLPL